MPVSVDNSQIIYDALKSVGVELMSALPETWLVHLVRMGEDDPDMTLVRLNKEEEGVGVSAGAHLAGAKSVMLISYRGHMGERDPWQTEGGLSTEPILQSMGIPYDLLSDPVKVEKEIREAQTLAESSMRPVALLLTRDLMWED